MSISLFSHVSPVPISLVNVSPAPTVIVSYPVAPAAVRLAPLSSPSEPSAAPAPESLAYLQFLSGTATHDEERRTFDFTGDQ